VLAFIAALPIALLKLGRFIGCSKDNQQPSERFITRNQEVWKQKTGDNDVSRS
jgi:hypothetical protein